MAFLGQGLAFFGEDRLATLLTLSNYKLTILDLPLDCTKSVCFFCKCISLMPDDSLERKGSSENKNAIWKTYN